MKKIANYLIALAVAAFTFTSCEDVPSPFGTVVQPDSGEEVVIEPQGSGTKSDPYNVAAALEFVSGLGADVPSDKEIYVKGYVTSIKEQFSAQYGNAQFTMSDTKEGANTFTFFRGLYLGNKKWVEGDLLLAEGDEVIVCGKVVNYKGNTPETVQNAAYTYSINGKTEGGGGGDTPSGDAKGTGTADDPFNIAAAIKKCQEIGVTVSTEKYYVKGIVVKGGTVSGGYGNLTFTLGDTKDATDIFTAYQVAGSDGEKLADGYQVNAGSEVVVYGPMYNFQGNTPETAGKSAAYIVTIDGKKTSDSGGGGGGTPSGDAKKVTVQEFLAAAESTDVWYELTGTIEHLEDRTYKNSTQYGNFDLVDETGKIYVYGVVTEKGGQKGQFEALMSEKGIKDGSKITIIGNRGSYNGAAQVTNAYFVKVEAGGGDTPSGNTGLEQSFEAGKGDFTIEDKSIGEGITYVWYEDTKNKYMKASAYKGGCIAAESWLISPAFSLKGISAPVMTFNNACNQVKEGNITDHIKVMVYDGANWTEASISGMPDGKSWTFVDSTVDLKSVAGKTGVKVAFKYVSTAAFAPTWEIKNVSIK